MITQLHSSALLLVRNTSPASLGATGQTDRCPCPPAATADCPPRPQTREHPCHPASWAATIICGRSFFSRLLISASVLWLPEKASLDYTTGKTKMAQQYHRHALGAYTPVYASPEQVKGASSPDPSATTCTPFGIIWYQMQTGQFSHEPAPATGNKTIRLVASKGILEHPDDMHWPRQGSSSRCIELVERPEAARPATSHAAPPPSAPVFVGPPHALAPVSPVFVAKAVESPSGDRDADRIRDQRFQAGRVTAGANRLGRPASTKGPCGV